MTRVPAPETPVAPPAAPDPRPTTARGIGSALRRSRLKPVRPMRLRLIDAVTLAAGSLLLLKLVGLTQAGPPTVDGGLPEFARVIAKARTGYESFDPVTTGSVGAKEAGKPPAPPSEPPSTQPPPESGSPAERALLEKLGARRDALRQRAEELELRERMLGEAERKLETGLSDLRQAEDKVEAAARAKEVAEKQGLRNIVVMYETMKPKDAARVFDRLGHDVLVPLVLAMNPRKMAEILSVMQPDSAERLTIMLANRARGVNGPQAGVSLPPNELPAIDPGPGR